MWQRALDLSVQVYEITNSFPKKEQYTLVSQLTRCAVSIPSNIAEGAGRNSKKEFVNFLGMSLGSSCELETQLIIANRLNYINNEQLSKFAQDIEVIQNMIFKLQNKLRTDN